MRYWEEQRSDGKKGFVAVYSIGFFIMFFMIGVLMGLFSGMPIIRIDYILYWSVGSAITAVVVAYLAWNKQETKFKRIIRRELSADQ